MEKTIAELLGVGEDFSGLAPKEIIIANVSGETYIPLYRERSGLWRARGVKTPGSIMLTDDPRFMLDEQPAAVLQEVELFEVIAVGRAEAPYIIGALMTQEQLDVHNTGHYQKTGRMFRFRCDPQGVPVTLIEVVHA